MSLLVIYLGLSCFVAGAIFLGGSMPGLGYGLVAVGAVMLAAAFRRKA